jgi:heme A synthase
VVTALFAYLQIALGGLVRVSGSGLGCPDWPLCNGRPYPPANVHSIIEYSHRAVGSVTGILIIATVVMAWVVFRKRRPLVAWLASASLIGVVGEGILGGIVVAKELSPWLVVVHLGLAMIILGFLVSTAVAAMPQSAGVSDVNFRRLAIVAAGATYVMMLTGSTVVASGADESCNSWPLCSGGFALDFTGANAFTMLHRGTVLVVGLLLLHVLSQAFLRWRSVKGMRPVAIAAIGYDRSDAVRAAAEQLHGELEAAGIEVLLDDRGERPGVMFADLELIGIPHRVTIGDRGLKEGKVEYQGRREAQPTAVPLADAAAFLQSKLRG